MLSSILCLLLAAKLTYFASPTHSPTCFYFPLSPVSRRHKEASAEKRRQFLRLVRRGRKGLRWCGFALFLVRFCGNFYFNSRYCGFKTLSGLRLLQPLSRGFRWKKVSTVITLFRTVGIRLFWKREPSVLFYNASGFIIPAYNLTLWFAVKAFSS